MPFTKTFNPGEILTAGDVNEHLLNGGYQFRETVYFTSSGTFVKADYPWLRAIRVRVVGGGGGSGGVAACTATQVAIGGAGGGGGYAESFITDIAGLDASVTVTRGGGGSGGAAGDNNGTAGTNSSFGALVIGGGGAGGGGGAAGTPFATGAGHFPGEPGNGGTGTGDLVIPGGNGSYGFGANTNRLFASFGAGTALGGGIGRSVAGARFAAADNTTIGGSGYGPGNADGVAIVGRGGVPGIVIVELYG
jgi:hypothetical protein